jgi:hypothetical protein
MTDKDAILLENINSFIGIEVEEMKRHGEKRIRQKRHSEIRSEAERRIFSIPEFKENMNLFILESLIKRRFAINWYVVSGMDFLTEEFIRTYINSLSPVRLLDNYPNLSENIKQSIYNRLGTLNKIKYGVITEEEVIEKFQYYGKGLRKDINKYVRENPGVFSESFDLFIKLTGF